MVNLDELPQDKAGKEIALNAITSQMIDLAAKISTGEIKDIADIDFYVWAVINKLSELLGE